VDRIEALKKCGLMVEWAEGEMMNFMNKEDLLTR
jgi:hypothetical protein